MLMEEKYLISLFPLQFPEIGLGHSQNALARSQNTQGLDQPCADL